MNDNPTKLGRCCTPFDPRGKQIYQLEFADLEGRKEPLAEEEEAE